jgi:hypothetical protein
MPVIAGFAATRESRGPATHIMGIVEAHKAFAVRRVQRERIRQAVRPCRGRIDAGDLELEPVALSR